MARAGERMLIGASWYPEMWPEAEWERDLEKMNQLGFGIVRLFEFAWHRLEPKMGVWDFDWAVRVMDLCEKHGVKVMVGTPTAAPPAWLTYGFPDTLRTHADGSRHSHGGRKHASVFSRRYREFTTRIVTKMAATFRDHPALHSWQIDNEMGGTDFGEEALESFHGWLRAKYKTIDVLNKTWGLEFWSQAYQSFDQVPLVQASVGSVEIPERHHPSLVMAAARHLNDVWSEFIGLQCGLIRENSGAGVKPISTNMTAGLGMHWYQHNRNLDRVGFSMYRDVEHYPWNLMNFDRMRAEKVAAGGAYVPYYLLETAPSWSAGGKWWNIHHSGAGVTAMSWMSTLLGGSMILYWQFRSHWAGQEMQHGTLVDASGNFSVNIEAITKICAEHAGHEKFLLEHPPQRAEIGIVLSHENAWGFSIDPIDEGMRYDARWRDSYYLPIAQHHFWRDVISEDQDFAGYKVLVLPLMPMVKAATRERLRKWVEAGGQLLLGPVVGHRTEEFTAWTDRPLGGLEELMGTEAPMRFTTHWQNGVVKLVFAEGSPFSGEDEAPGHRNQSEGLRPMGGAKVLARYEGGYGDGMAAILEHEVGAGRVVTLGTAVSEQHYVQAISYLAGQVGIEPLARGSRDVVIVPRADSSGKVRALGLVNLSEKEQEVEVRGGETVRMGPLEWKLRKV